MVTKPLPSTSSFRRISLPLWAPIFSLLEILPDSAGRVFDGDVKAELHLAERIQLGPPCPRRHKPPVDDPAPRGLQRALQHHLRHRSGSLLRLGKAPPRRMNGQRDPMAGTAIAGGAPITDRF